MVIYYLQYVFLMPYVYSFWQIFQALRLFPALHLFRTLEYTQNGPIKILSLQLFLASQDYLGKQVIKHWCKDHFL